MSLAEQESLFKDLVWDNIITVALTALTVAVPFLAVWPVRPIMMFIVHQFTDALYDVLKLTFDLTQIAFTNELHKRTFDHEAVKLHVIAKEKGIDSDEFKAAKEDAKNALAVFVHSL